MPAAMKFGVADVRHAYIKQMLGQDAWERTVARLTPEERAIVERGEGGMAPAIVEGRLLVALVDTAFKSDRFAAERFLRTGGASQADSMLDGVFSIFARFASPQQALKRGPSIFSSVYSGTSASSIIHDGAKSGALTVSGLGEYTYVAPWLSGWMERALERFGAMRPQVRERAWEAGHNASDELVFEVRWQ